MTESRGDSTSSSSPELFVEMDGLWGCEKSVVTRWLTYMLLYLSRSKSINLESDEAAGVLLAGQVADAIATPLVGIYSDRSDGCNRCGVQFGRRKYWYLCGALGTAVSFYLMFGDCLPCLGNSHVSHTWLLVYYCAIASLFNVGWAAVQVSHMSMVPELTSDEAERVSLNSARYAFTVLSNIAVFVIFFVLIQTVGGGADVHNSADSSFQTLFRDLALVCTVLGGLCSVIFLVGTNETPIKGNDNDALLSESRKSKAGLLPVVPESGEFDWESAEVSETVAVVDGNMRRSMMLSIELSARKSFVMFHNETDNVNKPSHFNSVDSKRLSRWQDWLYVREFYQVGCIYMATRLVVNVSGALIPFYLLDYLRMPTTSITIIPLVLYLAQFLATLTIKRLTELIGRRGTLLTGSFLVFVACVVFWLMDSDHTVFVYPAVVSFGAGSAIVMVVSQQLQADLVGTNTTSAAFVYGAHSFADKLSNGVAIFVIQKINGDENTYIRGAISIVPGASMLLGLIFMYLLNLERLGGVGLIAENDLDAVPSLDDQPSTLEYRPPRGSSVSGSVVVMPASL